MSIASPIGQTAAFDVKAASSHVSDSSLIAALSVLVAPASCSYTTTIEKAMEGSISTSASTVRSLHMPCVSSSSQSLSSQQSSPRSSALPSPPDSPSSGSVSSLPSVSSSFFFSSGAANSPQQSDNEQDHELNQGLIIPSLTLPSALRQPTDFGKTIGDVRLIVVTGSGAGSSFTTKLLLEGNEDIVDFDPWEQLDYGRMLRASTDWQAQHDPHGLEKYEPVRNIEIVELPGYTQSDSVSVRHSIINSSESNPASGKRVC